MKPSLYLVFASNVNRSFKKNKKRISFVITYDFRVIAILRLERYFLRYPIILKANTNPYHFYLQNSSQMQLILQKGVLNRAYVPAYLQVAMKTVYFVVWRLTLNSVVNI